MSDPKILITGANGQLGTELRRLSTFHSGFEFLFATKEDLPIDKPWSINYFFNRYQPQYCINCAAYTAVDKAESERELAFKINSEAVGMLADACRKQETAFIHISSDYVFDGMTKTAYTEKSPKNPVGVYGLSKSEGEALALENNQRTIIIRSSWVYSAFGKNFVKTMLSLMNEKSEINVVNDQWGSPTYAADLAETILQVISSTVKKSSLDIWGIYNYCNEGIITWYEFANAIKELSGLNCKINAVSSEQYPTAAKRPAYSVLDTTKIQKTFNIQLKNWKESLAVCLRQIENAQAR